MLVTTDIFSLECFIHRDGRGSHIVRRELMFRQTVDVVGHRWQGIFPSHPTLTPGKTDTRQGLPETQHLKFFKPVS